MQIVELKVNVEKSQLASLESQVNALNNKTINIKVNTAGITALDNQTLKTINTLTKYANAQAKIETAQAKTATATMNAAKANSQYRTQVERTRTAAVNLQTQQEKTRTAHERATAALNKSSAAYTKANKEAGFFKRTMGDTLGGIASKMFMWQAMGAAVSVPIRAMKEALSTMKEVDSQLVVIQKTTNFTDKQMKEIEQQAYKTASAYGQSADAYLQSVASFARAGYKEQSADLAELAIKTQLVGDTTAEVADQFLLSVDKAYKYNGSVMELQKVLDGADYINNNYATSIEKIAEGMGIVAPVAAQAHVGVDELMASIGTITAVTQRSGSEAARALRALFLNIIGDTQTEIEDGAKWTAGEIEGLRDVLRTFVPDVVATAEAANEVINPMEAIRALAEGLESGVIQEDKLMEMVSDIGGKLRTSQLLAIIQNWDMYESMLTDYQKAAGTADKEIDKIRNSWESKINQMKNSWTEFVSHMVDSDMIKGGIDGITSAIKFLDSDLGQAAIKAGALVLAFNGLGKVLSADAGSKALTSIIELFQMFKTFGAAETIGALVASIGPLGLALAGIAAILATPAIVDFFTTDYSEQAQKVGELTDKYEELYGVESEYATLREKAASGAGLSDYERRRLTYLEEEKQSLKEVIELEKERAQQKYQQEYGAMAQDSTDEDYYRNGGRGKKDSETIDVKMLREASDAFDDLNKKAQEGKVSEQEYRDELNEIISAYEDFYNTTKDGIDAGIIDTDNLTDAQKKLMELYETMQKFLDLPVEDVSIVATLDKLSESGNGITEFANNTVANASKIRQAFSEAGFSAEEAQQAIDSLREDGVIVIDVQADGVEGTLENLETLGIAVKDSDGWKISVDGLEQLAGELGLSKGQVDLLISSLQGVNGVSFDGATSSINIVYGSVSDLIGITQTYTGGSPYNATFKATDNASSTLKGIIGLIAQIRDKSVTIRTNYVQSHSSNGYAPTSIIRSATGSTNYRGGPTLLGDELSSDGSPRPELVISRTGEAFIAGVNGPVMASLPAGSRIFTYSETQEVLSGDGMLQVPAYAQKGGTGGSGTAGLSLGQRYIRGKKKKAANAGKPNTASNASSGGGSRASTNKGKRTGGGGGSRGGGGGGSSGGSTASTTRLDDLNNELDVLQAQYEFLEASNASTEDLIAKSKEIQAKLHEINGELEATGGEQKDIISNSTEWWEELEKQREVEKRKLSLLEKEYEFLEVSGASAEELNKKSKEIQAKLHDINENLRATNGSQEDILDNSIAWYEELKKIQQVQIDLHEDERDLLDSELTLMEHQGKSIQERIAKMKQIQDNLHREAEYMRSIGYSQAEINKLSIQWWEIHERILQAQKELVNELESSVNYYLKQQRKQLDAEIKIWQDKIDAAKELRDIQEDQNELDEKNKRILEAQLALKNAMNERTVRYYNASTGQWEWAADANNVRSAQEALDAAKKDYNDARSNQAYNDEIDRYQAEIDRLNAKYDKMESSWQNVLDSFNEPVAEIKDILKEMLDNGMLTQDQVKLLEAAGVDISAIRGGVSSIEVSSKESIAIQTAANTWTKTGMSVSGSKAFDEMGYTPVNGAGLVQRVYENGALYIGAHTIPGGSITSDGVAHDLYVPAHIVQPGDPEYAQYRQYVSGAGGGGGSSKIGTANTSIGTKTVRSMSGESSGSLKAISKSASTVSKSTKTYDSGGVLSGLGGIKATTADEIVIPPDIAAYMLNPSAPSQFKARMAELGYLYGTNKDIPGTLAGISGSRYSSDHYGDVYQYGNITLSEAQARSMTVYDLAQMSRSLSIYRNA